MVRVKVDFIEYCDDLFIKEYEKKILERPFFHTYWTDCPDIETYKNSVKENIQSWLQNLKVRNINDWLIILIESNESKKSHKFVPRSSVLDKIKNDLAAKHPERCISLLDPAKSDSRTAESWQSLLAKMRQLLLVAYNRSVSRFEEIIRYERERRTDPRWCFCTYFLLQEELSAVYELLEIFEETLVQYDELDALFTQFVKNSAIGDFPNWLWNFTEPCETWEGLDLGKSQDMNLQNKIRNKNISLLELRNYLFQRQFSLLSKLNRYSELSDRSLAFLQNTPLEAKLIQDNRKYHSKPTLKKKVSASSAEKNTLDPVTEKVDVSDSLSNSRGNFLSGGLSCWLFLSCLELIDFFSSFEDSAINGDFNTAPLWSLAKDKLKELGKLCGLMPLGGTTNEQLQIVIDLICGMGEDPHSGSKRKKFSETTAPISELSPMAVLKEALSCKESFKKHYLHLCEISISSYKHIGRFRSANLIGRDLVSFYMDSGDYQKAAKFLSLHLQNLATENWPELSCDTLIQLLKCYKAIGDVNKYLKTCIQLSVRKSEKFLKERLEAIHDVEEWIGYQNKKVEENFSSKFYLKNSLEFLPVATESVFNIGSIKLISRDPIILGSEIEVEITIQSFIPTDFHFAEIRMQLLKAPENYEVKKSKKAPLSNFKDVHFQHKEHLKSSNQVNNRDLDVEIQAEKAGSLVSFSEVKTNSKNPFERNIHMSFHLDYLQDKTISFASVNCSNTHKALSREDSSGAVQYLDHIPQKVESCAQDLSAINFHIQPGSNIVKLKTTILSSESLINGQIVLKNGPLEFITSQSSLNYKSMFIKVLNEKARIYLSRKGAELIMGYPQKLVLTVKNGSTALQEGHRIILKCSNGLQLRVGQHLTKEIGKKLAEVSNSETKALEKINNFSSIVVNTIEVENTNLRPSLKAEKSVRITKEPLPDLINSNSEIDTKFENIILEKLSEDLVNKTGLPTQFQSELEVNLPFMSPFSEKGIELEAIASLQTLKENKSSVVHNVSIKSSFLEDSKFDIELQFTACFTTSHKIQTSNQKKFVQVSLTGLTDDEIEFKNPELIAPEDKIQNVNLKLLNNPNESIFILGASTTVNFLWELESDLNRIKTQFSILYRPCNILSHSYKNKENQDALNQILLREVNQEPSNDIKSQEHCQNFLNQMNLNEEKKLCQEFRKHSSSFELEDFKTIFSLKTRVEPVKGAEFIRAGAICHLQVTIQHIFHADKSVVDGQAMSTNKVVETSTQSSTEDKSDLTIMFEVLTEQTIWAVCGKSSGVITFELGSKQTFTLDVMPLVGGLLPMPTVRIARYIPADIPSKVQKFNAKPSTVPRLEPFNTGQVYNFSKAMQIHVLATHSATVSEN